MMMMDHTWATGLQGSQGGPATTSPCSPGESMAKARRPGFFPCLCTASWLAAQSR